MRRFFLILIGVILFVGLIAYSTANIRYPVDGKQKTEYFVTERSLTHRVERGKDGKLQTPSGSLSTQPGQGKACPT
jgi:hypothetical protein